MTSSMTSQGDLKVALYIHVLLQGQCLVNTREYRNRLSRLYVPKKISINNTF